MAGGGSCREFHGKTFCASASALWFPPVDNRSRMLVCSQSWKAIPRAIWRGNQFEWLESWVRCLGTLPPLCLDPLDRCHEIPGSQLSRAAFQSAFQRSISKTRLLPSCHCRWGRISEKEGSLCKVNPAVQEQRGQRGAGLGWCLIPAHPSGTEGKME